MYSAACSTAMSAILKCAPTYECFMRLNIFPQVEFQITGAAFVYFTVGHFFIVKFYYGQIQECYCEIQADFLKWI